MEKDLAAATGIERRGRILALLTHLKQICNHPSQFLNQQGPYKGRSGKLERLTEMVEEVLENGERALIFTQFRQMGERLQVHFNDVLGFEPPFLQGSSTREQRDEMVRSFQEDADSCPIMLLSLKAGGVGLNLTAATHVFHFDRWWNPAVEDQATDRTYRIGQTKNVQVHKLITMGTLEEKIDAMLESKRDLADRVVGSGEGWLTELDDDALRRLVSLEANTDIMTEEEGNGNGHGNGHINGTNHGSHSLPERHTPPPSEVPEPEEPMLGVSIGAVNGKTAVVRKIKRKMRTTTRKGVIS